jgi:hypothetical protein
MAAILWGNINKDGSINRSSGNIAVNRQAEGQYVIDFKGNFKKTPAIVGSQTNFGDPNQNTKDNVVFPSVSSANATARTGDENGNHKDRSFSFIAVGE